MAIPDYQDIMLPLLKLSSEGKVHTYRNSVNKLAIEFKLTEEEQRELLPSGQQPVFDNRVGWAKTYLTKAKLLESPERGKFQITSRGLELLKENPSRITRSDLERYSEFLEFRAKKRPATNEKSSDDEESATPEELIEKGYSKIYEALQEELLSQVLRSDWKFFERLVVDLLVKMGYGGSHKDTAKAIGGIGDEGIDGEIKQDALGLDIIYLQAKRWTDNTVQRQHVQGFVGALSGRNASKGVFITTSKFSKNAIEYANNVGKTIVLIDGEKLSRLMIEYNVGVSHSKTYSIKSVDLDYFIEG